MLLYACARLCTLVYGVRLLNGGSLLGLSGLNWNKDQYIENVIEGKVSDDGQQSQKKSNRQKNTSAPQGGSRNTNGKADSGPAGDGFQVQRSSRSRSERGDRSDQNRGGSGRGRGAPSSGIVCRPCEVILLLRVM